MKKLLCYYSLLLLCIGILPLQAKVTLPAIISDNMVLQQQTHVNIWGKARPGEKVTVTASWSDKAYTVTTPAGGKWKLKLKTPAAAAAQTMTVKGENTITIHNI